MAAIALLIRFSSPGPIIFSQARSGLHGRPFRMYKFRSMVTNAEQARAELESMNEMAGPVFKVRNDPRVTWLGHWLRKYSLDELPQLWNVMRGEMSLVGPRPLPLYETANFGDVSQRRRMSVRPGLTCLWQVRGRNQITDFKDWVRLDLEYIDRWTLWLDIEILFRTVPVVIFGWGREIATPRRLRIPSFPNSIWERPLVPAKLRFALDDVARLAHQLHRAQHAAHLRHLMRAQQARLPQQRQHREERLRHAHLLLEALEGVRQRVADRASPARAAGTCSGKTRIWWRMRAPLSCRLW